MDDKKIILLVECLEILSNGLLATVEIGSCGGSRRAEGRKDVKNVADYANISVRDGDEKKSMSHERPQTEEPQRSFSRPRTANAVVEHSAEFTYSRPDD